MTTGTPPLDAPPLMLPDAKDSGAGVAKEPAVAYRSCVSRKYRGWTIGLSVFIALVGLGFGIISVIWGNFGWFDYSRIYASGSTDISWGVASHSTAGAFIIALTPISIAAAVIAGKRKPSKPWLWITMLILTVIAPPLILGLQGGYMSQSRAACNEFSRYATVGECDGYRSYSWLWPVMDAGTFLLCGVYYTIFFYKNKPDLSAPVTVGMPAQQPLLGPGQGYAAQGYPYGVSAPYGVAQAFPSYVVAAPQPQPYPGYAVIPAPQPYPGYAASYAAALVPQSASTALLAATPASAAPVPPSPAPVTPVPGTPAPTYYAATSALPATMPALPEAAPAPATPAPTYYAASPVLQATTPAPPAQAPAKISYGFIVENGVRRDVTFVDPPEPNPAPTGEPFPYTKK
ncbi:hypothetical protein Q8F55_006172 [Vanrija albida]|uniref:MARVEL domain-containing protein n=1 Tax=Vanrija albida TaxID=181172 RepID=A0ABR3PWC3_9TREE